MIYVDPPKLRKVRTRFRLTAHMVSDESLAELHEFAQKLGLPYRAFHNKPYRPHYDLLDEWIDKAIALGAKPVSAKEVVLILRKLTARR